MPQVILLRVVLLQTLQSSLFCIIWLSFCSQVEFMPLSSISLCDHLGTAWRQRTGRTWPEPNTNPCLRVRWELSPQGRSRWDLQETAAVRQAMIGVKLAVMEFTDYHATLVSVLFVCSPRSMEVKLNPKTFRGNVCHLKISYYRMLCISELWKTVRAE